MKPVNSNENEDLNQYLQNQKKRIEILKKVLSKLKISNQK